MLSIKILIKEIKKAISIIIVIDYNINTLFIRKQDNDGNIINAIYMISLKIVSNN